MHMIFVTGRLTLIRKHRPIGSLFLLLNHMLFTNHSQVVIGNERMQLHLVILSFNTFYSV